MNLTHLSSLLPAFAKELEKDAGLKDDFKAGTKKVITALKSVPAQAHRASLKAAVTLGNLPGGDKVLQHGPGILQKLVT